MFTVSVSAAEAARLTHQSERTIRRHIRAGLLPAVKRPGGWRVTIADLEARYGAPEPRRDFLVQHLVQHAEHSFPTHAHAARWIVQHADPHAPFNVLTPKTWRGWDTCAMTPRGVLELAMGFLAKPNHRIRWRLRRCGDASCVCAELLTSSDDTRTH